MKTLIEGLKSLGVIPRVGQGPKQILRAIHSQKFPSWKGMGKRRHEALKSLTHPLNVQAAAGWWRNPLEVLPEQDVDVLVITESGPHVARLMESSNDAEHGSSTSFTWSEDTILVEAHPTNGGVTHWAPIYLP